MKTMNEQVFYAHNNDATIRIKVFDQSLFSRLSANILKTYSSHSEKKEQCLWEIDVKVNLDFTLPTCLHSIDIDNHEIEHGEKARIYNGGSEGIYIWKNENFILHRNLHHISIEGLNEDVVFQITRKAIRQIFTFELEQHNGFRLHASSCQILGKGLVFLGEKGAGKTSMLLSSIAYAGAKYITNDVLETRWIGEMKGMQINGWPTVCLVGRGTLNNIDKYKHLLPIEDRGEQENTKIPIEIEQLEQVLETEILSDSKMEIVFFPKLNLAKCHTSYSQLTVSEGLKNLLQHVINEDRDHPDWLLLREQNINKNRFINESNFKYLRFFNIEVGYDLKSSIQSIVDLCK